MFARRLILGGIAALAFAAAASADGPQTDARPLSRADAAALQLQADQARLADMRPASRPVWMIRYPVEVRVPGADTPRPQMRSDFVPAARWDHIRGSETWTRAAMIALRNHGQQLEQTVPRDIVTWCPAYIDNPPELRRAFWVGMMSALAKHESTWRPEAVGGGGLWYGLLQIYPDTARRYGCRARTGTALTDPGDNLSCAVRIMSVTVPRDNAIAVRDTRWRGVAADWGPMTNRAKIADMAAWTREQDYCRPQLAVMVSLRPEARPGSDAVVSTMDTPG